MWCSATLLAAVTSIVFLASSRRIKDKGLFVLHESDTNRNQVTTKGEEERQGEGEGEGLLTLRQGTTDAKGQGEGQATVPPPPPPPLQATTNGEEQREGKRAATPLLQALDDGERNKQNTSYHKDVTHSKATASLVERSAQASQEVMTEKKSVETEATETEAVEAAVAQAKGLRNNSAAFSLLEADPRKLLSGIWRWVREKGQTFGKVGLAKFERVRIVQNVTGNSRNRWNASKTSRKLTVNHRLKPTETIEITLPFPLSEGDFGILNSNSRDHLEVSVIFDKDVEKEVWVTSDCLVKDDVPLNETDNDEAIKAVLEIFPRSDDLALFKCPITKKIFRFPVVANDGRTYERSAIEKASNHSEHLIPNYGINSLVKAMTQKVITAKPARWKFWYWESFCPWGRWARRARELLELEFLAGDPPALGAENVGSFQCPISQEFFRDPVVASDGHTYERESIEKWAQRSRVSPTTRATLTDHLFPNRAMKELLSVLIEKTDFALKQTMEQFTAVD